MSSSCMHAQNSDWTGPTPEGVMAATSRPQVYVAFTNLIADEMVFVRVVESHLRYHGHEVGFEGFCSDGRKVPRGIVCADPSHLGRVYIELDIEPAAPLLSIVAETG
jgi:hypothetical protein